LYVLEFFLSSDQPETAVGLSVLGNSSKLLHARLGHLSHSSMNQLQNLVYDFDCEPLRECRSELSETCLKGRQTRLPHNQHRTRATRPPKIIHSDVVLLQCRIYYSHIRDTLKTLAVNK